MTIKRMKVVSYSYSPQDYIELAMIHPAEVKRIEHLLKEREVFYGRIDELSQIVGELGDDVIKAFHRGTEAGRRTYDTVKADIIQQAENAGHQVAASGVKQTYRNLCEKYKVLEKRVLATVVDDGTYEYVHDQIRAAAVSRKLPFKNGAVEKAYCDLADLYKALKGEHEDLEHKSKTEYDRGVISGGQGYRDAYRGIEAIAIDSGFPWRRGDLLGSYKVLASHKDGAEKKEYRLGYNEGKEDGQSTYNYVHGYIQRIAGQYGLPFEENNLTNTYKILAERANKAFSQAAEHRRVPQEIISSGISKLAQEHGHPQPIYGDPIVTYKLLCEKHTKSLEAVKDRASRLDAQADSLSCKAQALSVAAASDNL